MGFACRCDLTRGRSRTDGVPTGDATPQLNSSDQKPCDWAEFVNTL